MQAKQEMEALKSINEKISGIIETVTNANGTAIKFADGTMICHGKLFISANNVYKTVQLPATFIDTDYDVVFANRYMFTDRIIFSSSINATSSFNAYAYMVGAGTPNVDAGACYIAIGKWKE